MQLLISSMQNKVHIMSAVFRRISSTIITTTSLRSRRRQQTRRDRDAIGVGLFAGGSEWCCQMELNLMFFFFRVEWLMTSQFHKRCKLWLLNQDMLLVIRWWWYVVSTNKDRSVIVNDREWTGTKQNRVWELNVIPLQGTCWNHWSKVHLPPCPPTTLHDKITIEMLTFFQLNSSQTDVNKSSVTCPIAFFHNRSPLSSPDQMDHL